MGVTVTAALHEPRSPHQWSRIVGHWVWIAVLSFLATFPVQQLGAFPSSLSDCQTPTGWNCSGDDDRDTDLFLCDTNTCKFDGECLRIGDIITCICNFKCNNDYVPVCGSNNENYENECFLRRDACKQQTEILVVSEGSCPADAGSGSGDEAGNEGSAENGQKETTTCDICQFGAECDEDAEDVCSWVRHNPSVHIIPVVPEYKTPLYITKAHWQDGVPQNNVFLLSFFCIHSYLVGDMITGTKAGDGQYARTDYTEEKPEVSEVVRGLYIPCPERYKNYCIHGDCEYPNMLSTPSCSCHSGFSGPQCDTKEYNVLYVVPGSGKLRYVLIASVIGILQVAIICVVVLCITRKCPRTNRINRQKQNTMHYNSENTLRASTRLI
ncbi:tomoregulin-2-like [Sinocyclocheilus grahami]|uniref:tomoregulin-2-like n=2 Tax=Sinocyclocheilus TaxID=75365 RepID=UPI0007AD4AC3|nr:PREDICTED: tomoregulin-2-like [Sinocyclocheilus grahami]